MMSYQPYNEYKDLNLCACLGPQGNDPVCPCAMRKSGKQSSHTQWTKKDIEKLKDALGHIFKETK